MVTITGPRLAVHPAAEVTVVPQGYRFVVECSSCGRLSTHTVEVAALEVRSWHHELHAGSSTFHLTFTTEEMTRLLAISAARAQDPEDMLRDILSQAIARPIDHCRLRMVS